MKKIEIIWRELLYQSIELGQREFTQKDLAKRFGYSTSTIFQALKPLREMGAVRVTGRNFIMEDAEKLLYHWASARRLSADILWQGFVGLAVKEIEGLAPPTAVFGGYSAACQILTEAPADYDKVYLYMTDVQPAYDRYDIKSSQRPNLFILKSDDSLTSYGSFTTIAQTFVDIWNMDDWYAKEFTTILKRKIDELLP